MDLVEHIVCQIWSQSIYDLSISVLSLHEAAHLQDLAELSRILDETIEEIQQKKAEFGSFLQVVPQWCERWFINHSKFSYNYIINNSYKP
jgi:hypothetical protein